MAAKGRGTGAGAAPEYGCGNRITFGAAGNCSPFLGPGWSSAPNQGSHWTDGPEAELLFRMAPPASDVSLSLRLTPFLLQGVLDEQKLTIYFNFYRAAYFEVRGPAELTATLPRELFGLRTARLGFHIPTCASPKKLRLSQDVRRLGLAFESVILRPAA